MHINPNHALASFTKAGIAAREASLYFICTGVAFMFSVCSREKGDPALMTQKDAQAKMEAALADAMKAGAKQMQVNVRNAVQLYGKLAKSLTVAKVKPLIAELSTLKDTEADASKAPTIILEWLGQNWGIKSVRGLSEALGYKTGARGSSGTVQRFADPAKFADALDDALDTVETELVATGKATEEQVARAVVARSSDPVAFIRAAIARISDTDTLLTLAKEIGRDIDKQIETLEQAAKQAEKAPAPTPSKRKAERAAHVN